MQAQVYALDKAQKWQALTQNVIDVSFLLNEHTGVTRIYAVDGDEIVLDSSILSSMQYRRPSDTFVQWFDTQRILYGLNLTSSSDADGFEREFKKATGKGELANNAATSPAKKPNTVAMASSGGERRPSNSSNRSTEEGIRKMSLSRDTASTANEAKSILQLRSRVQELEVALVSAESDKANLNETIASQAKTISGLQTQVKQLESDVDRLKSAFQQNASNVQAWKTQLQSYQQMNEELTQKMTELTNLYEKFGDILKTVH